MLLSSLLTGIRFLGRISNILIMIFLQGKQCGNVRPDAGADWEQDNQEKEIAGKLKEICSVDTLSILS